MSNYRALSIVVIMFSWIISFSASSTQSTLSVTGTITFPGPSLIPLRYVGIEPDHYDELLS